MYIRIHMCIIMDMNIYITEDNERYLKQLKDDGESMSGYINRLLENARGGGAPPAVKTQASVGVATPQPVNMLDPLTCTYNDCGEVFSDMRALVAHQKETNHANLV